MVDVNAPTRRYAQNRLCTALLCPVLSLEHSADCQHSGDGVCNGNEEGSNDGSGFHLKVAHPFIEGGDLGLRPVNVLDDSDLDLDLDLNPGHGYAYAVILHLNFTAMGQRYRDIDEIKSGI